MPESDIKHTIADKNPETDNAERNACSQSLGCECEYYVLPFELPHSKSAPFYISERPHQGHTLFYGPSSRRCCDA